MPSSTEAVGLLREIADLLDLQGERFKPEAYRRAARSVETLSEELVAVAGRGGLREVPGVGAAIDEKLREYLATGRIGYLDRLRAEIPAGLVEMMRLPGIGPKTTRRFWTELGVTDRAELLRAIEGGRLTGLKGFGPRKIEQVRSALAAAASGPAPGRRPIEELFPIAHAIRAMLLETAPTERVEIAGSFRRGRETVGDLDILVTSLAPEKVFDRFSALPEIAEVRMRGGTKETVLLRSGLQVDLRVVEPEAFGAALQYFTGSKEHNVRLRSLARDQGLKINEYGVFRGEERVGGRTEEEVYRLLGLSWIPPELREDHGEIDAARAGKLPRLVELRDLRGEMHVHLPPEATEASLAGVRVAAAALGLEYVGIVVATPRPDGSLTGPSPGLAEAVRRVRDGSVRLIAAAEILPHTPIAEVERIAPEYTILRPPEPSTPPAAAVSAQPAPRLLAHVGRDSVAVARWLGVARTVGCAVEVGPGSDRLDSTLARSARDLGLRLEVPTGLGTTDPTATRELSVGFARRAGASRAEIVNAGPYSDRVPTAKRRERATGS